MRVSARGRVEGAQLRPSERARRQAPDTSGPTPMLFDDLARRLAHRPRSMKGLARKTREASRRGWQRVPKPVRITSAGLLLVLGVIGLAFPLLPGIPLLIAGGRLMGRESPAFDGWWKANVDPIIARVKAWFGWRRPAEA